MPQKRTEAVPYLTMEDAIEHMRQVEREYGVHISFSTGEAKYVHKRNSLTFVWAIKRLDGQKGFKRIHAEPVDYPSRSFRTFPAMVVHTCSRLAIWLEEDRARQKTALEQTELFRGL